ncbi:calphotin-like [Helianthus annuus]|uniref:calphotin-like n=1 Tax=Helianthus annuus TaxID=4232 RepID=UPI000B8F0EF3|nr:calphotin-like [Helianthus annuus]
MSSSSESGVSDTIDPIAIVSEDEIFPEDEVFTSDTMSSDDDDFQPFALPDFGDDLPLADGFLDGDLPLAQIPAPIPLVAFPVEELPLDDMLDDDVDLFIEGPPEDDQDGGAPIDDDVAIPLDEIPVVDAIVFLPVEVPVVEVLSDQSGPDSFESVSSSTLHELGLQRYPSDTNSDTATSAVPVPPQDFEFDDEFDPDFPHDLDPDHEVEFIPEEQPVEAPVFPDDQHLDVPADYELAPADPEPERAPEPIFAHDPLSVHDPIPVDVPVVAPPVVDVPVVALPLPDPIPVLIDRAPFATHVDPRYAHTRNGWIEDDDDYPPFVRPVTPPSAHVQAPIDVTQFHPHLSDVHRTDLPVTFLQDIPPPRPGEGPSSQPSGRVPFVSGADQFMPQFPHTASSSAPTGEPFMWFSPNVMPLSDPYHPFHIGYLRDDLLLSLQLEQDMLSRRVAELERIPHPPPGAGPSQFVAPPAPLFPYPDFDIRFLTMEQQIGCLLQLFHALEDELAHMHRLLFIPPPPHPPPPPSA